MAELCAAATHTARDPIPAVAEAQLALHAWQSWALRLFQQGFSRGRCNSAVGVGPQVVHSCLIVGRVGDLVQGRVSIGGDHRVQPVYCSPVHR